MVPTVLIAGNFRLDFLHHAVYFCKDGIDAEFGYGQRDEAVDEPIAEGGILEQVSDGNRVFDAVRVTGRRGIQGVFEHVHGCVSVFGVTVVKSPV